MPVLTVIGFAHRRGSVWPHRLPFPELPADGGQDGERHDFLSRGGIAPRLGNLPRSGFSRGPNDALQVVGPQATAQGFLQRLQQFRRGRLRRSDGEIKLRAFYHFCSHTSSVGLFFGLLALVPG
ncbi:hypothetical protein [Meiothermus phage MMP17]|nr:hypothetical protein [Meiothermus phage MMP17]